jgi:hypothetical protein
MTNQSKESASKQLRNIKTPPKRWFKILDQKHQARATKPVNQEQAKDGAAKE